MNLQRIENIENNLIRNVLLTCWNIAEEMDGNEVYGCELHHELFNSEYYTASIWQTELDTVDLGVWDCLNLVKNYELENFGDMYTKLEAFTIANMVNYILGSHLLGKSEHLQGEAWDNDLTVDDLEVIQKELRAYIEGLADWVDFWEEVREEYNV